MTPRSPCHGCASAYARSGLFKNLGSFAELERRIERLPTEKERGDSFEVFVEAYLSTDEMVQAEEVWVTAQVPSEIKRRLNLPSTDYGYDGVFRTRLGELVAYQVKFRTGRASLPYAELATFFGISEKADRRVVLTNSVAMSAVAESRSGFQTTRGGDFDRLDTAQLAAIGAWIEGIPPEPVLREPRPHQRAALADIQRELADHNRAQVIMACGTGKTLVALWAAEQTEAKRVLVLVPSLNLMGQTVHAWAKWTKWGERFRYLCVCSDPTVTKEVDQILIRPEDEDFPVRTDSDIVARFLDDCGDAASVVFCTYQSAPVVGAAMTGLPPFDVGIFDEAHKTTGREGTRFAFALKDQNLPIRKRLFLTATPRHYDIRKRDREGDFAVASMDDEAVYGRVAHRLSFAQASAQNIIVPYKVIISVVDSEMIDNALLDQSEVVIEGDRVRAKWVAHQVALKHAVEEHDLKRVITFHSSIKAAAAFASDGTEGVGMHLPCFQRFHVSGVQPTATREEHMREFAQVERGVITNARCLTEGVDVPSVDMVAFMNPRRSRVDIVQAVGRAMRTTGPAKSCGYVLVPLFLELQKDETIDEALERSDFDEIAEVLNALRENDDELSDIIQTISIERGKTGGFDESRMRDKIEVLGPKIAVDDIAGSICTRLIEQLGITWDQRYGQLIAYEQANGDCNVPRGWSQNPKLASWCSNVRTAYKSQKLAPNRVARLERIGFVWNQYADFWEEMFAALTAFKQVHGDCNVPRNWPANPKLAWWCTTQRYASRKSELSPDRLERLNRVGFVWNPHETKWEEQFAALAAYQRVYGHCNVPPKWKQNPSLGKWCSHQRATYHKGTIFPDRIARLEDIGFVWDPHKTSWDGMFAALSDYKQERGDCNVPDRWKNDPKLGSWCVTQRLLYDQNTLTPDRVKRLTEIGFLWDPRAAFWETMLAALTTYKLIHGDCNVPQGWTDDPQLGTWCNTQRQLYKENRISLDRINRLDQLGFLWTPRALLWEEMFAELIAYKQTHGNCNVPRKSKDNAPLGMWCDRQRQSFRNGKLPSARVKQLQELGFCFVMRASRE